MLYKVEQIPVQAEGFQETTCFDIPPSGKAFKSLIDNIYSRKIEAPIRELSTNAFDAHIEAGIDEPFRMKLPTKFDLLFMVRDYGLGMQHDFIMGTGQHQGGGFKSLFQSTKDHDNTQVGMKGLGSKSPFAYTDAFILRVFSGTAVRTYSTYLGEDGIPQLAYQGEAASTERRGTAVQFPVQMKDIEAFYESAIRVLKGFPVLPEGLPATVKDAFTGSEAQPLESGSFWQTYNKSWLGEGAWAKQGCVLYPIDLDKLTDGKWLKTLGMSLVIDFPIGSVQMVDSREALSYDDETTANIDATVTAIHDEINERIKQVMATARTQWEIRALFRNDLFSNLGPLARSSTLYSRITTLNSFLKEGLPRNRDRRGRGEGIFYSAVVRYKSWKTDKEGFATIYTRNDDAHKDEQMDEPVFVYIGSDPKSRRGMNKRAELFLEENPATTAVVMLDKLSLKVHRRLGKVKVMRISDLPALPVTPKAAREPRDWERFKQFSGGSWSFSEIKEDDPFETDVTPIFLFFNKGDIFHPELPDLVISNTHLRGEDKMLRYFKNTRLIFINVRKNEKLSRWPEEEFPRYQPGLIDGVIPSLSKGKIIPLINCINEDRFDDSFYDSALSRYGHDRIRKELGRGNTNPFFELMRFVDRFDKVTEAQKNLYRSLTPEMQEEVISRALELGLEVLPPCDCMGYKRRHNTFAYPLLHGVWERLAVTFGDYEGDLRIDLITDLMRGGK